MKKILFLILLTFSLYQVKANAVSAALDTASIKVKEAAAFVDTSSTFKNMYSDVKAGLIGLAAGLKVGVKEVYIVLVRQQIVYSIYYLLVFILSIPILMFAYKQWGTIKITGQSEVEEVRPLIMTMLFSIMGLIMLLVGVFNIDVIVTGFVNPQYGAIEEIMNFIK